MIVSFMDPLVIQTKILLLRKVALAGMHKAARVATGQVTMAARIAARVAAKVAARVATKRVAMAARIAARVAIKRVAMTGMHTAAVQQSMKNQAVQHRQVFVTAKQSLAAAEQPLTLINLVVAERQVIHVEAHMFTDATTQPPQYSPPDVAVTSLCLLQMPHHLSLMSRTLRDIKVQKIESWRGQGKAGLGGPV